MCVCGFVLLLSGDSALREPREVRPSIDGEKIYLARGFVRNEFTPFSHTLVCSSLSQLLRTNDKDAATKLLPRDVSRMKASQAGTYNFVTPSIPGIRESGEFFWLDVKR